MPRWIYKSDAEYLEQIRSKVSIDPNGCWILPGFQWRSKGMKNSETGYGCFSYRGKGWRAHRLVWKLIHGDIPKGLFVLHKCDNQPCCNPDHLEIGTHKQNMDDMNRRGRNGYAKKTFCKQGHPFSPENTLVVKTNRGTGKGRQCRACIRIRLRVNTGWDRAEAEALAMIAIPASARTARRTFRKKVVTKSESTYV